MTRGAARSGCWPGARLRHIPRIPEKAFGAVLLPLVFVLLFAYVFGSAIHVPGGGYYHAYLVSGIFAQSMIAHAPGDRGRRRLGHPQRADGPPAHAADRARLGDRRAHGRRAGRADRRDCVVIAICGLIVGWAPHGSVLETAGAFGAAAADGLRGHLGRRLPRPAGARPRRRRRDRDDDHLPRDVPVGDLRAGRRAAVRRCARSPRSTR